jgi:hypothetical protein
LPLRWWYGRWTEGSSGDYCLWEITFPCFAFFGPLLGLYANIWLIVQIHQLSAARKCLKSYPLR